ncbi:MAG TPA: cysteine dioxygenase family protein [Verrucomicrobiae bacterium]|jgi:cysteine dioxygenase
MQWTLEQYLTGLDSYRSKIPLDVLLRGLNELRIDFGILEKFAQFSSERYRRNLLRSGPAYHALLLCWRNGQRSPIHDHRGSACAVRVLRGEATETIFEMTEEGHVFPVRTRTLAEGHICATEDLDIHQLSNLQPAGADLITLHIYSPPLLVMGQYSLTEPHAREFEDEVFTFVEGAGI